MKRTLSMALAALLILLALTPCALADGDALGAPLPSDMDEALSELNERLAQSEEEYRLLAIQKRLTDIQNTRLLLENAQLLARIASLTEELNTVQAQLNVMTESYNANFAELAEAKDDLAYARRRVSSLSATVSIRGDASTPITEHPASARRNVMLPVPQARSAPLPRQP